MALPIGGAPSLGNNAINQTTILNAVVPPEGPKSLPVTLDFTTTNTVLVDLTLTTAQGLISTVQSLFVDNSGNAGELSVSSSATQQTLKVPAGAAGWFTIVATNRPKITFTTPVGPVVSTILLNVPVSQSVWFPGGAPAAAGSGAAVFTLTAGNTAQNVWAAGAVPSGGAIVRNPKNATESLYVDIVNAAQVSQPGGTNGTSVELAAGEQFTVPAGFTGAVSVNATTIGHAFIAYGWGHS